MTEATDLWVFASKDAIGAEAAFSDESEITSGLRELMLPFPSVIKPLASAENVTVTPLVKTGIKAGTISQQDVNSIERSSLSRSTEYKLRRNETVGQQTLAVLVQGKKKSAESKEGLQKMKPRRMASQPKARQARQQIARRSLSTLFTLRTSIFCRRCSLTFAIDLQKSRTSTFSSRTLRFAQHDRRFGWRNQIPSNPKHVPVFSTLKLIEIQSEKALEEEEIKRREFSKNYNEAIAKREEENAKMERELRERIEDLRNKGNINADDLRALEDLQFQLTAKAQNAQKKFLIEKEKLQRERDAVFAMLRMTRKMRFVKSRTSTSGLRSQYHLSHHCW